MAERGRPKAALVLTEEEHETLARWARRPKSPQSLALRSRIVLACAEGKTNQAVAAELGCARRRWASGGRGSWPSGWRGWLMSTAPGVPRTVTDDHVEAVVVKTLTEKPPDATHWSTRGMAKATGMSQPTVSRIWKAFGLKPWIDDTFKLSTDPLFVDKVRDIVALYMNPPERAAVVCVDEKTAVQALDRTQPVLPLLPHTPERHTHDYVRHGTIDLFAALNLADGMVLHQLTARHRAIEFRKFLDLIDTHHPRRPHRPRRVGQLLDPQDPVDPALADPPSPLPVPLHPDLVVVDEPRRAMVRRAHHEMAPPRHPSKRQRTRRDPSPNGSTPGTTTPAPTSGTRPPTRSSTASPHIANESLNQETSALSR